MHFCNFLNKFFWKFPCVRGDPPRTPYVAEPLQCSPPNRNPGCAAGFASIIIFLFQESLENHCPEINGDRDALKISPSIEKRRKFVFKMHSVILTPHWILYQFGRCSLQLVKNCTSNFTYNFGIVLGNVLNDFHFPCQILHIFGLGRLSRDHLREWHASQYLDSSLPKNHFWLFHREGNISFWLYV